VEYVPFGEVFLEEKNAVWNTPFLFNGKELDKETGMSYYGARYYDRKFRFGLVLTRWRRNILTGVHTIIATIIQLTLLTQQEWKGKVLMIGIKI
jgi:hypothetical protein